MAELKEWLKGITFTIFGALLFYFFWNNVFANILNFVLTNGLTDTQDTQILGAIAWVSFVLLFIMSVPVYFIYSIIVGASRDQKTHPLEILKGIAVWCVMMPFLVMVTAIVSGLIDALPTISGEAQNIATGQTVSWSNADILSGVSTFGWFMAFVAVIGMVFVPFYYILKGYGQISFKEVKELVTK